MKRFILIFAGILALAHFPAQAAPQPLAVVMIPTVSVSSVTTVAGVATVTISSQVATAYSSGLYTYITHIHIEMYATGTLTGGATPVNCTTTNLNSRVFKFQTAEATGTEQTVDIDLKNPEQAPNSAINTVVTCPSTANVIWNLAVNYFQAP